MQVIVDHLHLEEASGFIEFQTKSFMFICLTLLLPYQFTVHASLHVPDIHLFH